MEKRKEFITLIMLLFFLLLGIICKIICFANEPSSMGQILRSQEILEEDEALRQRLKAQQGIFIKQIIVEGVTLLSKERIKEIILPFQKHWLYKEDIRQILELIMQDYKEKGHLLSKDKVSYKIKRAVLIIEVKE